VIILSYTIVITVFTAYKK